MFGALPALYQGESVMSGQIAKAVRHIPSLRTHGQALLDFAHSILEKNVRYDEGDPMGLMLLGYLSRQMEHLHSVFALVDAGQGRDATLIARTMSEGMAQLLWAYNNQPNGAALWQWYGVIEDWRQMAENEANGVAVDLAERELNTALVGEHGPKYYKVETLKRIDEGKALPADPYRRQWSNLNAADIFNQVRGGDLYDIVYRNASDRAHWSPRSILLAVSDDDDGVRRYSPRDPRADATSLSVGFQSLLQTLEAVNIYLKLSLDEQLTNFNNAFLSDLSE